MAPPLGIFLLVSFDALLILSKVMPYAASFGCVFFELRTCRMSEASLEGHHEVPRLVLT